MKNKQSKKIMTSDRLSKKNLLKIIAKLSIGLHLLIVKVIINCNRGSSLPWEIKNEVNF